MLRIRAENDAPLLLNEEPMEDVTSFTYLGSNVSHTGGADEDIKLMIGKARTAYHHRLENKPDNTLCAFCCPELIHNVHNFLTETPEKVSSGS